jgi:crotonobetainyl-CoA:carnitine CoA-transferase CaiB-like acyl-CoA transferase
VGAYRTRDGRHIQLVCLEGDRYWAPLCTLIGRSELIADPRFVDLAARRENSAECVAILDAEFAGRPLEDWVEVLAEFDAPWAVVQSVTELLEDPQVLANDYIGTVEDGDTSYRLPNVPVQFDGRPAELRRGPEHGEHTETVLLELGYGWDDIAGLQSARAIP